MVCPEPFKTALDAIEIDGEELSILNVNSEVLMFELLAESSYEPWESWILKGPSESAEKVAE